MTSKFIIDSLMPKYASASSSASHFQPFLNSHNNPSIVSQAPHHNIHNNSEGSPPLTGSEEEGSSQPSTATTTISSNLNSSASKMYPFVTNHPSTHSSYPTMPGFTSSLDEKSCG